MCHAATLSSRCLSSCRLPFLAASGRPLFTLPIFTLPASLVAALFAVMAVYLRIMVGGVMIGYVGASLRLQAAASSEILITGIFSAPLYFSSIISSLISVVALLVLVVLVATSARCGDG